MIIGAGIAGPVAALALQRADIKSIVYSTGDPAAGDSGPYLTVTPNGLDALAAIGVDGLISSAGFVTHGTTLFNSSGKRVGTIGTDGYSVTIRRNRLQRLLQDEALRRGIQFEFNKQLADAAIVPHGVEARFDDGTSAAGEMLIGCDGLQSAVRRIIDPAAPAPRDRGLLNFCGHTPSISAGTPGQWQMIFGRRAFFAYAADFDGGTAWFASVPRTGAFAEKPPKRSKAEWTRLLMGRFVRDAGPAVNLIAAGILNLAAETPRDLPHVPRWHYGPIIVIGDAAHAVDPTSGLGASMAIEDGVLLAKHLRRLPTVPAFEAFVRARRRRVERAVARGARSSRYRTPGPIGRMVRDVTQPIVSGYLRAERSLAWMHDHRVDWDGPIEIA